MFWHIDTDIISLIVIVAVYVCNFKIPQTDVDRIRDRRFKRCIEIGIGATVLDVAASVVMETPVSTPLYHLFMTAYFVFIELIIVEWLLYALTIIFPGRSKSRKVISNIVYLLYAIYALFCCLNPWTGLIYSLGPQNEYSRGPFFAVMLVLFALYTLALFILTLIRWRRLPKECPGFVLLLVPVINAVAIVVQLSIPGLLLIMPAYMICIVLAFLFFQTVRARNSARLVNDLSKVAETDRLTGLFNRTGMEAMVRQTLDDSYGKSVIVLIADIDDLKIINDTMGHAEGDRSIRLVSQMLRRHFRSGDTVVRYGGDEFLAFFTGSIDEARIRDSLQSLVNEFGALRIGEHDDVPLHGSIGAAVGTVGKDTFETLCSRADIALYYVKRNGKNGYAIYSPDIEE